MRPHAALYLVDQDPETTTSLGIFHYARSLVRGIAEGPDPGFDVALWVSGRNAGHFVPRDRPAWMRAVTVPGRFGTGVRRLVADHGLAPWLAAARAPRPSVVHFPKGWVPLWLPASTRCVATLHDTIVQFYRCHYPRHFSRLKLAYFHRMTLRALRRADRIIADSHYSANELAALAPARDPAPAVIPAAGVRLQEALPVREREGFFVIGSSLPHKATADALRLLDAYARARGTSEQVTVSGVPGLEAVPGAVRPAVLRVACTGRLPYAELMRRIARSRALIVLSEIEGFGLPLLEAYSVGTPVCFRDTTAMAEVLEAVPGAWDGGTQKSFFYAMDQCLNMSDRDIEDIRARLARRFDWTRSVQAVLDVYRGLIEH